MFPHNSRNLGLDGWSTGTFLLLHSFLKHPSPQLGINKPLLAKVPAYIRARSIILDLIFANNHSKDFIFQIFSSWVGTHYWRIKPSSFLKFLIYQIYLKFSHCNTSYYIDIIIYPLLSTDNVLQWCTQQGWRNGRFTHHTASYTLYSQNKCQEKCKVLDWRTVIKNPAK